ncbi:hypothetical protein HID58_018804 [Brassica napus]|uniref:Uncharacterized protein n=1 Tax=Brassica napus TaxID=3708 RepID=A0ABQ8DB07_BRANA|nr:hypothetical protein HID58_018804 [Brassica napus]
MENLLRRGATRHDASSFPILETLINHKANIRALFQSNGRILSQTTPKPKEGREVECCVLEDVYKMKMEPVTRKTRRSVTWNILSPNVEDVDNV